MNDIEKNSVQQHHHHGGGKCENETTLTSNSSTTLTSSSSTVTVSCTIAVPGKLLMVGGYVILDSNNVGLVLAIDKYFYTKCTIQFTSQQQEQHLQQQEQEKEEHNNNKKNHHHHHRIQIHVSSPQFDHSNWYYEYHVLEQTLVAVTATTNNNNNNNNNNTTTTSTSWTTTNTNHHHKNPFIEKTITVTLLYLLSSTSFSNQQNTKIQSIQLTIQADNDFYNISNHLRDVVVIQQQEQVQQHEQQEQQLSNKSDIPPTPPPIITSSPNVIMDWVTLLNTTTTSTTTSDSEQEPIQSQLQQQQSSSLSLPKFLPALTNPNTNTKYKTGLGSSACLVTSLVGALYYTFQQVVGLQTQTQVLDDSQLQQQQIIIQNVPSINHPDYDHQTNIEKIYKLAQVCHCYSQGKIGSGFDISAACYGSHIYCRFSETIILPFIQQLQTRIQNDNQKDQQSQMNNNNNSIQETLVHLIEDEQLWSDSGVQEPIYLGGRIRQEQQTTKKEHKKEKEILNQRKNEFSKNSSSSSLLQVVVADVSGGSESPSMAKKVLQWRVKQIQLQQQQQQQDDDPTASSKVDNIKISHWDDVIVLNQKVITLFQQIMIFEDTITNEQLQSIITSLMDNTMVQQNEESDRDHCSNSSSSNSTKPSPLNNDHNIQTNDSTMESGIDTATAITTATQLVQELYETFQKIRYHLRFLGEIVDVPIEPYSQTILANETLQIPGVISAFVPGAGGYDAMVCIYINSEIVRKRIMTKWFEYDPKKIIDRDSNTNTTSTSATLNPNTIRSNQADDDDDGSEYNKIHVCPLICRGVSYGNGIRVVDNFF